MNKLPKELRGRSRTDPPAHVQLKDKFHQDPERAFLLKIDDRDIPIRAVNAWKVIIQDSTDKELSDSIAHLNNFIPGFRPGKAPADAIRKKLHKLLDQSEGLPDSVRVVLDRLGISSSLVAVFSEQVIQRIAPDLASFFGDQAYAAMLLDDRADVREIGLTALEADAECDDNPDRLGGGVTDSIPTRDCTQQEAGRRIAERLAPFINDFSEILGASTLSSTHQQPKQRRPDSEAGFEDLKGKLAKAEAELKRSKAAIERMERQLHEGTEQLEKAKRSRDKTKAELTSTLLKLTDLESKFDEKVQAELHSRLNERVRPWLISLLQTEQKARAISGDKILSEVQRLLDLQAQEDKRYGLVTELEKQLEELKLARGKLLSALSHSVKPRREIPSMVKRLDVEAAKIEDILGRRELPKLGNAAERVTREIQLACDLDELAAIRVQVVRAGDTGAVNPTEARHLLEMLFDKSDQLYWATTFLSGATAKIELLDALPNTQLRNLLSNHLSCRVLIDGHNALFRLQDMFEKFFEDGFPQAEARSHFLQRLEVLSSEYPALTIDVWFDSPDLNTASLNDNLKVHYSGGAGANRADNSIVAHLKALKPAASAPCFVVTDDNELRLRCRDNGAKTVACREFASLVRG